MEKRKWKKIKVRYTKVRDFEHWGVFAKIAKIQGELVKFPLSSFITYLVGSRLDYNLVSRKTIYNYQGRIVFKRVILSINLLFFFYITRLL